MGSGNTIDMGSNINNTKKQKPVILILDTSGSMGPNEPNTKIDQLNRGVRGMLNEFAHLRNLSVEFKVAIIAFGGTSARIVQDYVSLKDIKWTDLQAQGRTPLGGALELAKSIIEDDSKLPRTNACRPTVILMSDGIPTDDWEEPMRCFTTEGRTAKCDRFVASILGDMEGTDKEYAKRILASFVKDTRSRMFEGENATDICEFMSFMSSSVAISSQTDNPNVTAVTNLQQEVKDNAPTIPENWGKDADFNSLFDD